MTWTAYPDIDILLRDLRARLLFVLSDRLSGLYLFGSLVTGDFDHAISDIDLLAVGCSALANHELEALHAMHDAFAADYPSWSGRIEVAYVSEAALRTFRTRTSTIAVISPGEPFHTKEAGRDWLMNWWMVREQGLTLYGPPPAAFIDPISQEEFLANVREHTSLWRGWLEEGQDLPFQGYVIVTACRAMCAVHFGEQISKRRAVTWARERYPQWARTISNGFAWREEVGREGFEPDSLLSETLRFVEFAIMQITAGE